MTEQASSEELAKHIARAIFAVGDELGKPIQRIEFKAGSWSQGTEIGLGGLCEDALFRVILRALEQP